MDNGGVCLGCAGANILARLDHGGAQRVFAQLHRRGAADNAGAHDKDIVLHSLSLSLSPGAVSAPDHFFYSVPSGGPSRASTAVKYAGSGEVSSMCSPVRGWMNFSVLA